jgi:hypothetical protein
VLHLLLESTIYKIGILKLTGISDFFLKTPIMFVI